MPAHALRSVCVFTGSSYGYSPAYEAGAVTLGERIAEKGVTLIYGGASVGLMGVIADAALAAGGRVIGVLPRALADIEIAHNGLSELRIVESMHERKMIMADASDAFVALPGGLGTLEETLEVWTWTQLGIHAKPVGFFDIEGYFEKLFAFLDHAVTEGFVKPEHRQQIVVSSSVDDLLDSLDAADVRYRPKWIDKPQR